MLTEVHNNFTTISYCLHCVKNCKELYFVNSETKDEVCMTEMQIGICDCSMGQTTASII